MYGRTGVEFPRRIVCLTTETAEIAYLVGAGERVVGVPGTAGTPEEVLALEPDLVLAFSDRQKDVVCALAGTGPTVLCTNQRSFEDVLRTVLLIGGALGCEPVAREIIQDMSDEVKQIREYSSVWPARPRVYFEEWPDPLIAGIRWVSDLIEIAGGRDVFDELREQRAAAGRVVRSEAVIERNPEIILASWCGKAVDRDLISGRPGWDRVAAVRLGQIHELEGSDILSPGPSLMVGLRRIHEIIQAYQASR